MLVLARHTSLAATPYRTIIIDVPPSTERQLITVDLLEKTGTGARIGLWAPQTVNIARGDANRELYAESQALQQQ